MTKLLPLLLLACLCRAHLATAQEEKTPPLSVNLIQEGQRLYNTGQYRSAIAAFHQVERNDSNYTRALYALGICYVADSQYQKSSDIFRRMLTDYPELGNRPDIFIQYAAALENMGQSGEALALYDTAIRQYPACSSLYIEKGAYLLKLARYGEAEKVLKQVLVQDPYARHGHYLLGACAIKEGKLIPAILSTMGALLIDPKGLHHDDCLNLLNVLVKNAGDVPEVLKNRREQPSDTYRALEQVLHSGIALQAGYKPLFRLDDTITRQIQVLFEKLEYNPSDSDFWMQYYVPLFKEALTNGNFEPMMFIAFSGFKLDGIKEYLDNNKKELYAAAYQANLYFNTIRATRELQVSRRDLDRPIWMYNDTTLVNYGLLNAKTNMATGPMEFYYASGNLKSKGRFNNAAKKEGPWTFYYYSGPIWEKSNYIDGKQEGEDYKYFPDGTVSSHSWYKNDLLEGISTTWYNWGAQKTITPYKGGNEEGSMISFYSNGDTSSVEHYGAGLRQGESRTFHTNRNVDVITTYTHDVELGHTKKYFENGVLGVEGDIHDGKKEGLWKTYHPNGKLKSSQNYVNDKAEGEYKEFYDDGSINSTYTAKGGRITGDARYYDVDGKLFYIATYANGRMQKVQYFDKAGQLISSTERNGKTFDLAQYDPGGWKSSESSCTENDNLTGTATYYYPSGKIAETDAYQDGTLQGPNIAWYPGGEKKSVSQFANGKANGYHRSWYQHGAPEEEGRFTDGMLEGTWLFYNKLGQLTDSIFYSGSLEHGYKQSFWPTGKKSDDILSNNGRLEEWTQYDSTGKVLTQVRLQHGAGAVTLLLPNGKLLRRMEYKWGSLEGPYIVYFPDGKILQKSTYTRGKEEGAFIQYFHSGTVETEGRFHAGQRTGTWKFYTRGGKLRRTLDYQFGKMHGHDTWYYDNGKTMNDITYKDGDREGLYKNYDEDGVLLYQVTYRNNKPYSYSYLDKQGKLLPGILLPRQSGKVAAYFPNGHVSAEATYKDGYLDGPYKLYHSNGQLRAEKTLTYGQLEGPFAEYYASGQLHITGTYLHDQLHGSQKIYNEKSILTEDTNYYLGSPHGDFTLFDGNGKAVESGAYYYGNMLSVISHPRPE